MKFITTIILSLTLIGCAGSGVIGVVYNQKGIVRSVFKESPAEKAGILVDDRILNTKDLRGAVGSMCRVKVERNGQFFEKLILRIHEDKLKSW
jgi:C-terminal processing protease CtpA/Prc